MRRPTSRARLFPYTTLFRSNHAGEGAQLEDFAAFPGDHHGHAGGLLADGPAGRDADRESHGEDLHPARPEDRKSTRLNSSHVEISYAVFCLKKKKAKDETAR